MRTRQLRFEQQPNLKNIQRRYLKETDPLWKARLLCVKLAVEGQHSAKEIATICKCSRATVFERIKAYKEGEIENLLQIGRPGRQRGKLLSLTYSESDKFREGVKNGRWATAMEARLWVKSEWGVEKSQKAVWTWIQRIKKEMKKTAPLRRQRPHHHQK